MEVFRRKELGFTMKKRSSISKKTCALPSEWRWERKLEICISLFYSGDLKITAMIVTTMIELRLG